MAFTRRIPIYGSRPPCAYSSRLEERRQLIKSKRLEKTRKLEKPEDIVVNHSSDDDEEELNSTAKHKILFSSNNPVDFIRAREYDLKEYRTFDINYGTRHVLAYDMLKENPIALDQIEVNKIFCSAWLSHRQVVFGTKCNKLMVYDVLTKSIDQIPCLVGTNEDSNSSEHSGMHALSINPSRGLLATGAKNSNEIGIYKLPTLDPAYIGENGHDDWIFDIVWLDDQFLASGSRDTKITLWRVPELEPESTDIPSYSSINPVVIRTCKVAQKVRAFSFNKRLSELAAISVNGYIHIWSLDNFRQKISSKLSNPEPVCMSVNESGSLYAVGCRKYTLLVDSRCLQLVKKINSKHDGIRSTSFKNDLLTIGTGGGAILFYDLKADKPLDSGIHSNRTVVLRTNRGYQKNMNAEQDIFENGIPGDRSTPAIYTHCYDHSGLRLFTAGGPLPSNLSGNYASIWQ